MIQKVLFSLVLALGLSFQNFAQLGQSLHFDGSDVVVLTEPTIGTGDFTIETWFKPSNLADCYLISNRTSQFNGAGNWFTIRGGSGIILEMGSSTLASGLLVTTPVNIITVNAWNHVAVVRSGLNYSITVNGVLQVTATDIGARNISNGDNELNFGAWDFLGGRYYTGLMDETRLWNVAKTVAQISAAYRCELSLPQANLTRYYKYNQGIAGGNNTAISSLTDLSTFGQNGTLSGFLRTGPTSNFVGEGFALTVPGYSVCTGAGVLIVPTGASTYTISGGSFSVTPAATTPYTITATAVSGCTFMATTTVSVLSRPTITANSATICSGTSAVISGSGAATYSITGGTFTVAPVNNASYSVTGTGTNGCVSASAAVISVSIMALPPVSANQPTICSGSSATITPAGANSYTITGGTFTPSPNATSNYTVTGTGLNGCKAAFVSTVTVNASPTVSINNATICSGQSATLMPGGASAYTITGNAFTVSPSATSLYSLTGSSNGCASVNTVVATVSVNITPTLSINSATICAGSVATLNPGGANSYTITGGSYSVSPAADASYTLTGASSNGCAAAAPAIALVSVIPVPPLNANNPTICSGTTATIIPSGASTYTISGGSFNPSPAATANYTIAATAVNGCTASFVSTVSVNITPTVSINSATICSGRSATLTPGGASAYTITGGTFTVSPLATALYSLTGASNGCVSANTVVSTVSVNATPTLSINSATICSGQSVTLSPGGASTYTITGNTFTVSPAASAAYSLTGTASNGCVSANAVVSTVSVNATPTLSINSATICSGQSVTLTPGGAGTYTITGNTFTVSPSANASYSLTGTASNGCVAANIAVASVSVNASPTVAVNGATICAGATVTITPGGANTYTISGNSFTLSPAVTQTYALIGAAGNGCLGSAILTISVNALPTLTLNSTAICAGASATLTPAGAVSYTISGGAFTVSPAATTSYSVTGTDANGCNSAGAVATVSVNSNPTVTVNSGQICAGGIFTIMPAGAISYSLTGGTFTVSPGTTSAYTVTGTDANGCMDEEVSSVTVNALPPVAAMASGTLICTGTSATLTASGAVTYSWSTSATTQSIVVSPAGAGAASFAVTGTGTNNCVNTAVVDLTADDCTAIHSLESAAIFHAYPNPTSGLLMLDAGQGAQITVLNAAGQVVLNKSAGGASTEIDLGNAANGIYIILVQNGTGIQKLKIVKQ